MLVIHLYLKGVWSCVSYRLDTKKDMYSKVPISELKECSEDAKLQTSGFE